MVAIALVDVVVLWLRHQVQGLVDLVWSPGKRSGDQFGHGLKNPKRGFFKVIIARFVSLDFLL